MKLEIVFKDGRKETFDVAKTPTEGKLFEVNLLEIDRSKFEKPMLDQRQEWTRQIIQDAFLEVDKYPNKYASAFYTLIPVKKWYGYKTVAELKVYAKDFGGLMADWVEQAMDGLSGFPMVKVGKPSAIMQILQAGIVLFAGRMDMHGLLAVRVLLALAVRRLSFLADISVLLTGFSTLCLWLCLRKSNTVHGDTCLKEAKSKTRGIYSNEYIPLTY